ncbi:UNVERIFIED_CONTAM: hypothetical protein RMT77_011501 [Armadillidium vulgare]
MTAKLRQFGFAWKHKGTSRKKQKKTCESMRKLNNHMHHKCNIENETVQININDDEQKTNLLEMESLEHLNSSYETAEENWRKKIKKSELENT